MADGCTFPGCSVPAAWCEADHITNFSITGRTSVDDGHLLCPHHHREKDRRGWHVLMINSIPHWLAPAWLDPDQIPRRNHAHGPVGVG